MVYLGFRHRCGIKVISQKKDRLPTTGVQRPNFLCSRYNCKSRDFCDHQKRALWSVYGSGYPYGGKKKARPNFCLVVFQITNTNGTTSYGFKEQITWIISSDIMRSIYRTPFLYQLYGTPPWRTYLKENYQSMHEYICLYWWYSIVCYSRYQGAAVTLASIFAYQTQWL